MTLTCTSMPRWSGGIRHGAGCRRLGRSRDRRRERARERRSSHEIDQIELLSPASYFVALIAHSRALQVRKAVLPWSTSKH